MSKKLTNKVVIKTLEHIRDIADKHMTTNEEKVDFLIECALNISGNAVAGLLNKDVDIMEYKSITNAFLATMQEWFDSYIKGKMN